MNIYRVTGMTNSIIEKDKMDTWLNPRLFYLKSFVKPLPNTCPECGCELTTTEDEDETICTGCGLITSMSIEYVASHKIILPYGRH
jgi:NAD-dependent DNA ligase